LSIYVGEDQQYHAHALYTAIMDYLFSHGVSGATAIRGIAGFGAHHKMHTARILDLTVNLPVKIDSSNRRKSWRKSCQSFAT